jgi:hypothetical protein
MKADHVRTSVLLVESEQSLRADLSRWLTEAGFDVVTCSGPHLARPACSYDSTGPCQLVRSADVVVLDEWLESDTLMTGPPAWELVIAYRAMGKRLVVLAEATDPVRFEDDPTAVVLGRPPGRAELIDAVEKVAVATVAVDEAWLIDALPSASGA